MEVSSKPIFPKPLLKSSPDEAYSKDKFVYDFENDTYTCPKGNILKTKYTDNSKFKNYHNVRGCKNCPDLNKCTLKTHRILKDQPYQNFAHVVDKRTKENAFLVKKRMGMIENIFGSIKYSSGFSHFLTRRLDNVATETFLHFLTYNLKRLINILGVNKILQSI